MLFRSGLVSTWMGDRLGIPGAVSIILFQLELIGCNGSLVSRQECCRRCFGQQGEALRVLDRRCCKPAGVGVEVDAGVG